PAVQPSCPAFIGVNADRQAVTTAWEGLDEDARSEQPSAGALLELGIDVKGVFDPIFVI
ncbi:SMP-30/gluconolactonase/LRE family protein, partial [Rhizobium ruizarguesonis]